MTAPLAMEAIAAAGTPAFPFPRDAGPLHPPSLYARLREATPISRVRLWDGSSAWVVTRWEDVRTVLGSPHFSVDPQRDGYPSVSEARAAQVRSRKAFINMDDPDHARFRRMLTKDFMQKRMLELRPLVESLVQDLYRQMEADTPPADFVQAVSTPLPSMVISLLLGVPFEDHKELSRLSSTRNDHTVDAQTVQAAAQGMETYLDDVIRRKERDAVDSNDMLDRLVIDQIRPGNLTRAEAVRIASLLYSAGHGTTSSQIALGTLSFLRAPEQRAALVADPALLPAAVEEMLRFHSIAHFNSSRVATADVEIAGQLIRAGEGVYALVGAANRDPAVFPEPDRFDIQRERQPHMAFAYGIHQCLGQPLARLELNTVFSTLFQRFPRLELAVPFEELEFVATSQVYSVVSLPVRW